MLVKSLRITAVMSLLVVTSLGADTIQFRNGDRLQGKVLQIDGERVVFESDSLGKVTVPRGKIDQVQFGSAKPAPTTEPAAEEPATKQRPAVSDSALLKELRARGVPIKRLEDLGKFMPPVVLPEDEQKQTPEDVVRVLRRRGVNRSTLDEVKSMVPLSQLPGARSYLESTLEGLVSGRTGLHDLRKDAQKARDSLKDLKRDLGPSGDALNGYLQILDGFLDQTKEAQTVEPEPQPDNDAT